MNFRLFFTVTFFFPFVCGAQELFPNNEPAGNIPKGVLGMRLQNEFFKDQNQLRSWQGYKFMFGLSDKWMLTETFSASNHHGRKLPVGFITDEGNNLFQANPVAKGKIYPYLFETLNLNLKYRFLKRDGDHTHFRMAAWLEAEGGNEAHPEAEPGMTGDNAGIGGGIIATQLVNKFAVSASLSGILPAPYYEHPLNIQINYGKAAHYDLSFGYLALPLKYKNYKQTNLNLYVEVMGCSYEKASITYNGYQVNSSDLSSFGKGDYLEVRPALQFIFNSNTRVDFSASFLLEGISYARNHPAFYFNVQHYFYFSGKKN